MRIGKPLLISLAWIASTYSIPGLGDQFHYQNVLMGDRAMGLGGAFTAISDDASGLVYNPAGLAFALSNDISGSANAFYKKTVRFEKVIGEKPFDEVSAGSTAPFFGGLQKMDNLAPGVAFAFGLFNRDSELRDQDTNIYAEDLKITRFHRAVNLRAQTSGYGVAAAKRLISSLAMGLGLTFLKVDELEQTYQDVNNQTRNEAKAAVRQILTQNIRERLTASAIEVSLGMQWSVTPRISLGMNIKVPTIISQTLERSQEQTIIQSADGKTWTPKFPRIVVDNQKQENPLGTWPSEYRFGSAFFVSTAFLITADVMQFTAAKGDEKSYERDAVTNFAIGTEYFITPPLPIRFGLFSNNDSRPELKKDGTTNQRDHIDYLGATLFLAWVQPNSQVAFGGILQKGKGSGQKFQDEAIIHNAKGTASTVALSASHNF